MQPQSPQPPRLLSQQQFNAYSAAWVDAVRHGDSLPAIFQQPGQPAKSSFVRFPLQDIVWLVSTVGSQRIKVQFLLKPDAGPDADPLRPRFTMALFSADAQDGRISAYYLGKNTAPTETTDNEQATQGNNDQPLGSALVKAANIGGQLPHGLAGVWLKNWVNVAAVTPDLFTTNYGPLQGYVFDLQDFMDPLFYSQSFFNDPEEAQNFELRIGFGLHEFYPAFPEGTTSKKTFGLVLRIYQKDSQKPALAVPSNGSSEPFYDLSVTSPPGA
ncbi:MAG: hypothetical protein EOO63_02165 [Hymenobacter sp.]|nr:MAG: hypothetical protein EOO63_02165 [Hymenobacter sp.]